MRLAALAAVALIPAAVVPSAPQHTLYPSTAWPIVSTFGSLDAVGGGKREKPNPGVDIIAIVRTPVFAVEHGEVTLAAVESLRGKVVELRTTATSRPLTLSYAHLHGIEVSPGERVAAGQRIGSVGDTGHVPRGIGHLSFEVRGPDSRALDPEPFLRARPDGRIECVDEARAAAGGYPPDRYSSIRSGQRDGAAFLYPVACIRHP